MDAITVQEKEKYETIWTEVPAYRNFSPGKRLLELDIVHSLMKERDVKSVLDAGCGTGRATKALIEEGYDVVGVDITLKAVTRSIHEKYVGSFFEVPLWDLPKDWPAFDCIFCVDVLEHIPPEKVDDTLSELVRMCGKLAVFNIALFKDGFGDRIGERLHLSLFSADEWEAKLAKHFKNIQRITSTCSYVTFACDPKENG